MSTRYETPKGDKRALAAELFVAARQADALERAAAGAGAGRGLAGRPRFGMNRLYAYAVSTGREDAELERALEVDADLGEAFRRLLDRTAGHVLPRVAAASQGVITGRDGVGCHIRFQDSRAEPDQTYVIIEIADTVAEPPAHMFIVDAAGKCRKFSLPEARNGVIQFLVERDSALLSGLRDIKTEVFLK
jgi:hypothetical protein